MYVKNKGIFLTIALVLVLASIASLVFRGFNLDTDFAGGMAVTYEINSEFSVSDVEAIANEALGADRSPSSVQRSGNEVIIKFGFDNDLDNDEARSDFAMTKIAAITEGLIAKYGAPVEETPAEEATEETPTEETPAEEAPKTGVVLKSQDIVSPSTGRELARSAVLMSILACIAILLYVTFRFEFTSGVVAVLALVHDVVILLGIYSLLQWSVDTNFIAAVLTVLGYSINNTIVIMDRIRENTRHARKETYGQIANKSIAQTLNRSINTTITTLLTIGMVYILGVPSIQAFSLPIIIGILVGFYSSVFVAGPLWATWRDSGVKKK
ncbi:MAG: protein translocase subunit SecF [Clostridia bacterium]|nr:protein translocase subunit SecF [Clostridia bacterium]